MGNLMKVSESVMIQKTEPSFRYPGVEVDLRRPEIRGDTERQTPYAAAPPSSGSMCRAFRQGSVQGSHSLSRRWKRDALVLNGSWSRRLSRIPPPSLCAEGTKCSSSDDAWPKVVHQLENTHAWFVLSPALA
ncbi:hypothetical protein MRX96_027066 [Rhipicephalus microplus]